MLRRTLRLAAASHCLAYLSLALLLAVPAVSGCGARTGVGFAETNDFSPATPAGGASGNRPLGTGGASCESITVDIANLRPTVMLLVDQSGSMASPYPDRSSPETRWSLVRKALFDSENGVVKQFEHSLRFGIAFFTSHNGFEGGQCPILSEVSAATDNYQALSKLYDQLQPDDDTPTGAALQTLVNQLQREPPGSPQSILLVTDGDADTCEVPDPQQGQPDAVAAAERAFSAGISVSVLGISNDIAQQNLQQLANAGKGRAIDAVWGVDRDAAQPFEASHSVQGLTAQLGEILGAISLCTVPLLRDTASGEASSARVLLDDQSLKYGTSDGFTIVDPRHLAITGRACETLKERGQRLTVRIGCD